MKGAQVFSRVKKLLCDDKNTTKPSNRRRDGTNFPLVLIAIYPYLLLLVVRHGQYAKFENHVQRIPASGREWPKRMAWNAHQKLSRLRCSVVLEPLKIIQRYKTHGNLRQKRRPNLFVQRHTDFIKLLCIALVKYERIQTTLEREKKLEKYGNLVR